MGLIARVKAAIYMARCGWEATGRSGKICTVSSPPPATFIQNPLNLPEPSPQANVALQINFVARLNGSVRRVNPIRLAFAGHLVVQSVDGLSMGIIGEESVSQEPEEIAAFRRACEFFE